MLNKKALAASLSAKETDADFKQTVLLLHGDGTNGAQNNTFTDSSTNAFTITRNGNTTQGTFSPFSQTGWSNYFDGSGDYISLPNSSISLGSGNCAVEFWCYITGEPSANPFLFDNFGNSSARLYAYYDGTTMYLNADGTTRTTTFAYNTWNFFQFTRSSGTGGWYLNGNLISTTFSTSGTIDLQRMTIGAAEESGTANSSQWTQGYISNFRASTTNRSTSVPTTAFASDSNTIVLTCQSNRFVDNSASPLTLTTTGNTSVQAFSPFAPTDAYSAGTNGGSGYFDGSGDYLSTSTSQIIPTGSFTIEAWVYTTQAISTNKNIVAQGSSGDSGRVAMSIESSKWWFQIGGNVVNAGTPVLGQWNYVAMTYNGSTVEGYVNGVSQGTVSNTNNAQNTTLAIGTDWNNAVWNGYIASVRISNTVRTVTTVPTTPFTSDANTRFLCNFTNAGIIDQTGKNVLETVGNAQIDTGTKKFGTGSLEFDGNGDYLVVPAGVNWSFGTGDFTVETWVYLNSVSNNGTIICNSNYAGNSGDWILRIGAAGSASGKWEFTIYGAGGAFDQVYSNSAPSTGSWVHLAAVRSGGTMMLFIDGTKQTVTDTSTTAVGFTNQTTVVVGDNSSGVLLNCFLDEFRVTKGVARYTANFTVPSKAFADQ